MSWDGSPGSNPGSTPTMPAWEPCQSGEARKKRRQTPGECSGLVNGALSVNEILLECRHTVRLHSLPTKARLGDRDRHHIQTGEV